ncbi:hypothetical protein [Amycolatopsis magusensis]|uniref:hypothetical protein n=1 Tax=Amycolatopsis magusensis TaxID=882444 RepID=UPI0037B37DD6
MRSRRWRRTEHDASRPGDRLDRPEDTATPIVHVVDGRNPDRAGVPEGGLIYGYARPTSWGFLLMQTGWLGEAERGADQVGPIELRYHDRSTGTTTSLRIRPLVACPHGRWLWVDTGWAVDDPGRIAAAHPLEPPTPQLLYDVRWHAAPDRFGHSYRAEMPHWKFLAWCATEDWGRRIAAASIDWDDEFVLATQVQRPGPDGRAVVATCLPDPRRDRPARPATPVSHAADWPAATPPAADSLVISCDRSGWPLHVLRVHTGAENASWETVCWVLDADTARGIATDLGVGLPGFPYRFAEVWSAHPRSSGDRWTPDLRVPTASSPEVE